MIIGIDLGTTNSLAAYFEEDGAKIIPNRLGQSLTPSIVSIDDEGNTYVGETAKERRASYPLQTAEVFKRSMGTDKEFKLGRRKFRAEELSSIILKSLKEDAEAYLGQEVTEAIISVPAYFNDIQRKATKKAGELAGLKVDRIINEPTAAAVAYGLYNRNESTRFLVFDLGGGTFDISILELYHNIMEVHCVAGDNYLGGEDFTDVIFQLFLEKHELTLTELEPKTVAHIRKQAEKCKLNFEDNKISTMNCNINGQMYDMELSVKEYELACKPLFAKLRKPIERSLKDSNIKLADIDEIVLVGGSTKLSIIRRFVSKLFGRIPDTSINPDEAIALGAAMQAAMKERKDYIKETILTDVCPFTLGTEIVVQRHGKFFEDGHFLPIIERNTIIPVSRTETLYTVNDNQSSLRIKILQGESRFAQNNLYLGELLVKIPPRPAGMESITVTYTYDINSLLEVMVKVNSTEEIKKIIIQNEENPMSEEEIAKRMEELNYLKIPPREQEENKLLLFRGERLYEEATGMHRQEIDMYLRNFEDVLDKQDLDKISEARIKLKEELDSIEEISML